MKAFDLLMKIKLIGDNNMKTYKIYDTITKEFNDKVYNSIKVARNIVDKKNLEYGSYRYLIRLNH